MSIDRVSISNQGIDRAQKAQGIEQVGKAGKDSKVSSTGSDSLTLSSKAKDIERLTSSIEGSRAERLNQVQKAMESGTYRVSATNIAQKLIDSNRK